MQKIFLLFMLLLLAGSLMGQKNFNDSIAQSRNGLTKKAMLVLGSWSVANIGTGLILAGQTNGETKYAWNMNVYWNIFNLGIAGLGYAGLRKTLFNKNSLATNEKAQQAIEKLYVFNCGLDLFYLAGGFYLIEKGETQSALDKKDQFMGYGKSIIVQGSFLLGMDAIMYLLHHKNGIYLNKQLENFEINAGAAGLGLAYRF
jgi:hypothetical protein